jgi:hypothetical protein
MAIFLKRDCSPMFLEKRKQFSLLQCVSPLLAQMRSDDCIEQCLLSGVTRKTFAKRRETGKE